jgi:hypothetical protein
MPDVELDHLVAGPVTGVGHVGADGYLPANCNLHWANPQITEREGRVAQAMAEGKEGLAAKVTISTTLHGIVVKGW